MVLGIRDAGMGVPETAVERISDPFYRVQPDRDRATGGTGLGISTAKRAVVVHQGSIAARNCDPGLLVEVRMRSPRN